MSGPSWATAVAVKRDNAAISAMARARLEAAGCPSYWVVDPVALSVTAWELERGHYVEDPARTTVWTAVANLVPGWANCKGNHAAWRCSTSSKTKGDYIGQIDLVRIIGQDSATREAEVEYIAAASGFLVLPGPSGLQVLRWEPRARFEVAARDCRLQQLDQVRVEGP